MAGKIRRAALLLVITALILTGTCFAETQVSAERTVVWNSLPEVTVYMDTDRDYSIEESDIRLYVNDTEAELTSAGTFKDSGAGALYFILVDISRSLTKEDFETIKSGIAGFCDTLSAEDRIYLIPFGESVYLDQTAYEPGTEALEEAIDALTLKDDYTQLYAAIDAVVGVVESEEAESLPQRKLTMVFSDGLDDTTGGLVTRDEAISRMNNVSIPLYAFASGNSKEGKDGLGLLARSINGTLTDISKTDVDDALAEFKNVVDNTVVVSARVKNSEDIADSFTLRITRDGEEFLLKENVRAHKTEASKDVLSVTLKKLLMTYWWIPAVAAVALIALIVLLAVRKHKEVVVVDGKVVYSSKVQKKYHVQVKEHNTREIVFEISVNGGKPQKQEISVVESIIVGRGSGCDVHFDDVSMSRQHFSIELADGELYLNDLESTGGTYLNGVRVYARQRLSSGDLVNAGKTQIRVTWS